MTDSVEQVDEDGPSVELLDGNVGQRREPHVGAGEVADVGQRYGGAAFGDGGLAREFRGFRR